MAVCRRCVISPRFLGVLWYCCTVFRRTDVPSGRRTAFWSCRCVFTYYMVCTSTSFTVPSWYRPIGEIAPGCLLSAAALPGKAVCSIYHTALHPSERWHRVRSNPRVSATAPGPRGDIRAPLLSRTITTGTCVVSTLFTRGNESSFSHLIGMKIVRSQPSSQHTYGTCRLQPPSSSSSNTATGL